MREKWERKIKSGKHPTFAVPTPVQPPLQLMFDILMFSYQNEERNKKRIHQLSLIDKGVTNAYKVFIS